MKPIEKTHPEQQEDEIYLGNTIPEALNQSTWKTSRLGDIPRMVDGSPIAEKTVLRPWFIKRFEVQAALDAELAKPSEARMNERISVYTNMLSK